MNMLMLKSNIKNLDIIKEKWRKECYEILAKDLIKYNIKLVQIIQEKYKDKIKFSNDIDELDIEIDYNGDGAFSKITATYYSKPEIWEKLKEIIKKEKKENGINL